MNLKFSLIITCHNYELYIAKAIHSAKSQTHESVEVIVVDAGSSDHSREIIQSFDKIVLVDAPKGSHALACYAGFKISSGDVIVFLDADDLLASNTCEKIAVSWTPQTVKAQYNLQIINKNDVVFKRTVCQFPKYYSSSDIRASFRETGTYVWPMTSGNAYARFYCELLFPVSMKIPVDGQLNTLAPAFGEVQVINETLGSYRIHDSNMDYQSNAAFSPQRFIKSVRRRYREYAHSRRTGRKLGKTFPKVNPLNHEFHFISYRLFLKQCDQGYFGSKRENRLWLMSLLLQYLYKNSLSFTFMAKVLIWHTLLLFCPSTLANWVVKQRFQRDIA